MCFFIRYLLISRIPDISIKHREFLYAAYGISVICRSELSFLGPGKNGFTRIGFSWEHALIVLLASLVGSGVNIPVANLKSTEPVAQDEYIHVFGVTYRIPVVREMTSASIQKLIHNQRIFNPEIISP